VSGRLGCKASGACLGAEMTCCPDPDTALSGSGQRFHSRIRWPKRLIRGRSQFAGTSVLWFVVALSRPVGIVAPIRAVFAVICVPSLPFSVSGDRKRDACSTLRWPIRAVSVRRRPFQIRSPLGSLGPPFPVAPNSWENICRRSVFALTLFAPTLSRVRATRYCSESPCFLRRRINAWRVMPRSSAARV